MDGNLFRRIPPTVSCCFCATSKTGARIIGGLQAVGGIFFSLILMLEIVHTSSTPLYFWTHIFIGVYGVLNAIAAILILRGVNQAQLLLVRIWISMEVTLIVFSFVVSMVIIGLTDYHYDYDLQTDVIYLLIVEGVQIYCTVVVCSYYNKETDELVSRLDDRVGNI